MSFLLFDLRYSGEECFIEHIPLSLMKQEKIGKFCGRRYHWSVFVSSSLINLRFHSFELSTSQFIMQFQLTNTILNTILHNFPNVQKFDTAEEKLFVLPFSWNTVYFIGNISYYTWGIFVPKMYKLIIQIINVNKSLVLFDGPDFHSNKCKFANNSKITASSFQIFVLYKDYTKTIKMGFESRITKDKTDNYVNYTIKSKVIMNSNNISCMQSLNSLCAFKLLVPETYFVDISILSLKYFGPNVGYCKYGGLSIYDHVDNTIKEVLLLCDNLFPISLSSQHKRVVVSSYESLFLIFYSYLPYGRIELSMVLEKSTCKGIHVLRYESYPSCKFRK